MENILSSFDSCGYCPYKQQRHLTDEQKTNRLEPPIGLESNNSKTLLVFQSPGVEEWECGKAIQNITKPGGTAGARIYQSWERTGFVRNDFDIVNLIRCFSGSTSSRDNKPDLLAICSCVDKLIADLNTHQYERVISFGDEANQIISALKKSGRFKFIVRNSKHPNGGASQDSLDALW